MNVFSCLLNSVQLTSLSRRLTGKLFQIRGPAAAKHLSPKRLWTRVTEHFLPEENLRDRAELSEARWIVGQIARYFAWQHLVYQAGNLEFNSSSDRQPMMCSRRCMNYSWVYSGHNCSCSCISNEACVIPLPETFILMTSCITEQRTSASETKLVNRPKMSGFFYRGTLCIARTML